ncbi:M23 family metallopeptidase [Plantibacter sp. YIM 135347]|uniref:M23 family metallopeptidase n=1 Tax=Plantibacter sp. YIM 135347 TaxID=3423919 RepID=UPI003D350FB6
MALIGGLALATSVPAQSLPSAGVQEVGRIDASTHLPAQSVRADGATQLSFTRDAYTTSTIEEAAAATGIRPADTFTNNPTGSIQWPFVVGVTIGDRFGFRDCAGCSSDHHGQDFNPGDGAPIQVIADGVVRHVEDGEGSLGVHVIVDHTVDGRLVSSVYAHLQHGSARVVEGQSIAVGTVLGLTGSTGMSTGPHLHFEIRLDGVTWVDPLDWLYANVD